jgi:hypothetical protein
MRSKAQQAKSRSIDILAAAMRETQSIWTIHKRSDHGAAMYDTAPVMGSGSLK